MPDNDEHKEYIERPDNRTTDRFIAETDIRDYIAGLAGPIQGVCHALIVEGQSVREVTDQYGVSTKTVLRHVRKALAPRLRGRLRSGAFSTLAATWASRAS